MRVLEYLLFMRRYFHTFIGGIFLGVLSITLLLTLYADAFYRSLRWGDATAWVFGAAMFAIIIMCVCHFFIVRGRVSWVWGAASIFFICFLLTLPAIEYRPQRVLYFFALLFPLMGLLVLNSNKHREMRRILVVARYKRLRFFGIRKARMRRLKAEKGKVNG
ncbi:hypothetical protein [Pseudomonas sp. NPDC088444]|uniref:hypothetical protein n=1 Tax=Pseudomonas sp. NPDC088444 TaxID=3364456 RepID=UPI00385061B4